MTVESAEVLLCAGRCHRILWHDNTPTLLDHAGVDLGAELDGDVEAELLLAVLSGDGCLARVVAWRRSGVENIASIAWRMTPEQHAAGWVPLEGILR